MSKIKALQKIITTDKILIHGSPNRFHEIQPSLTDGEIAICATQFVEIAIFMALCHRGLGYWGYKAIYPRKTPQDCKITFTLSEERVRHFLSADPIGYLYLLNPVDFKARNLLEFRKYQSSFVNLPQIITKDDLPFKIEKGKTSYDVDLDPKFVKLFAQ